MPGLTPHQARRIGDACGASFFSYANLHGWQETESFKTSLNVRAWSLQYGRAIKADTATIEQTLAFAAGVPAALKAYDEAAKTAAAEHGEEPAQ